MYDQLQVQVVCQSHVVVLQIQEGYLLVTLGISLRNTAGVTVCKGSQLTTANSECDQPVSARLTSTLYTVHCSSSFKFKTIEIHSDMVVASNVVVVEDISGPYVVVPTR